METKKLGFKEKMRLAKQILLAKGLDGIDRFIIERQIDSANERLNYPLKAAE